MVYYIKTRSSKKQQLGSDAENTSCATVKRFQLSFVIIVQKTSNVWVIMLICVMTEKDQYLVVLLISKENLELHSWSLRAQLETQAEEQS